MDMDKLDTITKNRMRMSLCLIMIMEHQSVYLDEMIKFTGYDFQTVNKIMQGLIRLKLIEVSATDTLPLFTLLNINDAKKYLKVLEDNLYLQ